MEVLKGYTQSKTMKKSVIDVKKTNRNLVYRYVLENSSCLRTDISEQLRLSAPTVLSLTNELIDSGYIYESGKSQSTGGRKASMLSPVLQKVYAVGVNITQNHISFALTDISKQMIDYTRIHKPFRQETSYVKEIHLLLEDFLTKNKVPREKLIGIGFSIPGIVNNSESVITVSHALRFKNMDFTFFSAHIPYYCYFMNDANAAAYCEAEARSHEFDSFFYFSMSNTVGGALYLMAGDAAFDTTGNAVNGLRYGDRWKCGEVGHIALYPDGKRCYCGKHGCFDAYCSALALTETTNGSIELFMQKLENQDYDVGLIWNEYLDNLARMIANIRSLLDLSIIIGGYVGGYIEPYLPRLSKIVAQYSFFEEPVDYLYCCQFKVEASAFGAALIEIERYIDNI